jgi:hypothetical protein
MVVEAAMTEIAISNESDVPLISFTLTKRDDFYDAVVGYVI